MEEAWKEERATYRCLGYGTHGHLYVMQAEQTRRGYELPPP